MIKKYLLLPLIIILSIIFILMFIIVANYIYVDAKRSVMIKYGVVDKNENIIIPIEYSDMRFAMNGRYIARKGLLYGVLDKNGDTLIPFKYNSISQCSNGYFLVETLLNEDINKKQKKWFYIPQLLIEYFKDDYYYERLEPPVKKSGVLDETGKVIIPCELRSDAKIDDKEFLRYKKMCNNIVHAKNTTEWQKYYVFYRYKDKTYNIHTCEVIQSPELKIGDNLYKYRTLQEITAYELLYNFKIFENGRCGLIDKNGNVVMPCKYYKISWNNKGEFLVATKKVSNIFK